MHTQHKSRTTDSKNYAEKFELSEVFNSETLFYSEVEKIVMYIGHDKLYINIKHYLK